MGLQKYQSMRDFSRTPEPKGDKVSSRTDALQFTVQRHDATRLHYDFRLELEGVLKSWAVPKGPSLDPKDRRLAVQTEDHPLEYGDFEGVIPEKQYGAGDVLLWDRGTWIPEGKDPSGDLRKGHLRFALQGRKLKGRWSLIRTRDENWLLIKRDDEEARAGSDITHEQPESVKESSLPAFVQPQLATLVSEPPKRGDWIYEVKHDGYRMLARFSSDGVRLFTRSGNDWTKKLPSLKKALEKIRLKDSWLDGEIVVPGSEGRSSFQQLQNAFDAGRDASIVYYVFDAPFLNGEDLRDKPLSERKSLLKKNLKKSDSIRFSDHLEGKAEEVLEHACKLRLEGLIGKLSAAPYVAGRSRSWIKLKCRQRQDFVIGGYTAPGGSRTGFGALMVGVYKDNKLEFAGKVGTGFDEDLLKKLLKQMQPLKRDTSPFANAPREKGVTWIEPRLVGEVEFAERTDEGILRQASFMGLRKDLPAKQVGEERAVQPIHISSPERLVWPKLKFRKIDLAHYVEEVAEWFIPHLAGRPLTLVRCPDGAEGECFYQRHLLMAKSPGNLKTVPRHRGTSKGAYIYLDSLEGALSAVQNGAVEFHTWGAVVPDIHHPDRFTMDLDPAPDLSWKALVEGTLLTKQLLDSLKLASFLKTTGGKGLHIVVPIQPQLEWPAVKEFTRRLANFLVKANPKLFVSTMSKEKRSGKIFIDYLRNSETASAVAAFSPRARPDGGVSMPLSWDELGKTDLRAKFNVKNVPGILRKRNDPWADYATTKQAITERMASSLG
ncbi:MAG TPA: DNA ligase D [Burkholderiales bacterium]|nr:DNA ligase D [Burkholderiales bacterium]